MSDEPMKTESRTDPRMHRTGEMRVVIRAGEKILQEKFLQVTWPFYPYTEKGEEIVTEHWKDIPVVVE